MAAYGSRRFRVITVACIIVAGIASRLIHTGWLVIDKYLGDALYAALVYSLLGLVWQTSRPRRAAVSMTVMTALEFFQLTMIPAHMLRNGHLAIRLLARLLGTQFSFVDLATYAIGITLIALIDREASD